MREYDLLVGILACQLRLVSRGALIRFAIAIAESPNQSLLEYLVESKALTEDDQAFLCRIADTIVHAHHGDEIAALRAFGGDDAAKEVFSGSIARTDQGWGPAEDQTILAERLPHGLPAQIAPEAIGRYTRGSEYARGGIGRILLVHDEQIGRDVILKELLPEHTVSPTDSTLSREPQPQSPRSPMRRSAAMMARFLQEAKITGQLEHPSIVPVYELGTRKDGQLYYTMKLVRGETLAESIKKCKNPEDRLGLLRSFLDVCQAMAYAHAKGVIHRDLKPSNIMVGEFGECVVLDWGLAKMQKDLDAHRDALEKTISQLKLGDEPMAEFKTRSKDIMGTPLYMAPEQARGEIDAVGVQSDVYSLGVVLYEILTGDLPHPWSNSLDTIRRVGTIPAPSIKIAAPHTPPELAAICDKALAFHPGKRYATAKELASDVQHFLEGAVVGAYAYKFTDLLGRLYRKHKPIILTLTTAGIVLLIVGILSYVSIYKEREKAVAAEGAAKAALGVAQQERDRADAERNRATDAEAKTAREKYVSDIRLADSYVREFKLQSAEDTLLQTAPEFRRLEWEYLITQCNQELASLNGHRRDIFAYLSPDASRTLTLSGDGTAKLWDNVTDQVLFTWALSDSLISGGAFSPDGKQVVIWMHDGSIRLFDPIGGAPGPNWKAHAQRVLQCSFNADGKLLASTGDDRVVKLWKLDSQEALWESTMASPSYRVGFCENDARLIATPEQAVPVLLDAQSGAVVASAAAGGRVRWEAEGAVILSDGSNLTLVAGPDLTIVKRFPVGGDPAYVAYYPESNELLTGTRDGIITLLDAETGTVRQQYNLMRPLHTCRLDHRGARVFAVSFDGNIRTFDKASGRPELNLSGHRHQLTTVDIAPDDSYILTASVDGTAKRWDTSAPPSNIPRAKTTPGSAPAAFSLDGKTIALGAMPGKIDVLNLDTGSTVFSAQTPDPFGAPRAALSPDGRFLALVLDDFLPVIIDMEDQTVVARLEGHQGVIYSIKFNNQGTEIITTSWDNTARIWNAETGENLGILSGHEDTVYDAAFAPDGSRIATVSLDRTAIVWDRSGLSKRFTIPHDERVTCCAFSPDGTLVATGVRGGTIKIWNSIDNTLKYTLTDQTPQIMEVTFSADGQRLLSPIGNNKIAVWEMGLGLRLPNLAAAGESNPRWFRFNAPANSLLSATEDGILREHLALPTLETGPVIDRPSLAAVLDAYSAKKSDQPPLPATSAVGNVSDLFLPAPTVTELLLYLQGAVKERADASARLTFDEPVDRFYPFRIQSGDTIATVANLSPAALFSEPNKATLEGLLKGEQPFSIDLIRGEELARFRLHGLPVRQTEHTVTLTPERAAVLLQAALDIIRNDTTTVLQVTRDQTPPGGDPTRSIQVPTLRDPAGKALLLEAGLVAGTRLVAINEAAVKNLPNLMEAIELGITHLREESEMKCNIVVDFGAFERLSTRVSR